MLRYDGGTGAFIDAFVPGGAGLVYPLGLTFGPDGALYVASRGPQAVLRFDAGTGAKDAGFVAPSLGDTEDIAFGPDGNLYVASLYGGIVRLDGSTGALIDTFVAPGSGGLSSAAGLAFGPDGRLYVSDQDADALRCYDAAGGAYLGDHVAAGAGGLDGPAYLLFAPDLRVTVVAAIGPSQALPPAQGVNEDGTLVFSAANGNAVTVSDGSAADGRVQVTLSVTGGTLTLAQTAGLTIVSGANASATMVIDGLESAVNAALNGLSYAPSANYHGGANLQVTTALAADLSGHYTFDTGTAADGSAGSAQDGSLVGNATTVVDATRGMVLSLDGTGDSVQIAGTFGNPSEVTIGGWVNFSGAGRQEFISLDDRVHIALDDGGSGVKGSIQTGASSWLDLPSGQSLSGTGWHHVMYSYSDSADRHTLYIDGVEVATATTASSIDWTGATTTFIGEHPGGVFSLQGLADDVRIYTRALDATEIANLAADQPTATGAVAITVAAVNDSPTVGGATLAATTEDAANPPGDTIANLFSGSFADVDAGASLGGGIEMPFNDLIGGQLTLSVHPDFTYQYDQPSISNVTNPYDPTGSTKITIPERRIRNITIELSFGLRLLRKVVYEE